MNLLDLANGRVLPGLAFLADWSIRWGILLALFLSWLAVRPPRDAASRYWICATLLAAGIFLPFVPRWASVPLLSPAPTIPIATPNTSSVVTPYRSASPPDGGSTVARQPERTAPPRSSPNQRAEPPDSFASLGMGQSMALIVGCTWVLIALVLIFRLFAGRLVLARLRQEAVDIGGTTDSLLNDCRRALSLSRPVVVAVHPSVGSPVTLGGRAPLVLVPPDWGAWTDSNRRACLLHELAHLARRDDFTKTAQEIIRCPFFFHPLVHWLLRRLDRERELICDEAAVALGADPLAYARLLLDLARRPGASCRLQAILVRRRSCSSSGGRLWHASNDSWRTT